MMHYMLVLVTALTAVIADPPNDDEAVPHRPLLGSTPLGEQAGTPDPDVRKLLEETDYTNEQIHYMPQTVTNPDCYVTTYVIKEQRHGGRCSRMSGGLPFCGVKNYVYPNHPDCINSGSGAGGWASSRWGPYYSRSTDVDPPTESTDEEDDVETVTENPIFRVKRNAKKKS